MNIKEDVILWLDLETTGSKLENSEILEVGISLTDNEVTKELSHIEILVKPTPARLLTMDPVVIDMHISNGLVADLLAGKGTTLENAEKMILRWMADLDIKRGELVPLAGSGVSHFDRQFIRRDWPDFNSELTYWAYDVGVVRRTLRLAGYGENPADNLPPPPDGIKSYSPNHRALQDARAAASEFAQYLQMLKSGYPE